MRPVFQRTVIRILPVEGWKTVDCVRANTVQRYVTAQAHSIWRSLISHTSHPPAHGAGRFRALEMPLLNTSLAFVLRRKEEVRLGALSTRHSTAYISFFQRTSLQFYAPLRISPCSGAMQSTLVIGPATGAATGYSPKNTILLEPSDGLQKMPRDVSRSLDLVTAAGENGIAKSRRLWMTQSLNMLRMAIYRVLRSQS